VCIPLKSNILKTNDNQKFGLIADGQIVLTLDSSDFEIKEVIKLCHTPAQKLCFDLPIATISTTIKICNLVRKVISSL
jgi:hypothetical protein